MELKTVIRLGLLVVIVLWVMSRGGQKSGSIVAGSFRYMLTRRPVLYAVTGGFLVTLAACFPLILSKGWDGLWLALLLAFIFGVCGGTMAVLFGFMIWASRRPEPQVPLEPGEEQVASFLANHVRQGESRGGTFRVTSRRFLFVPHRFNIQVEPWVAPFRDVQGLRHGGGNLIFVDTAAGEQWLLIENAEQQLPKLLAWMRQG